ncbi:hypothetical protein HYH02_009175 [Chlamydomonas schloesseri]|uniref:Uncharacterized protein n=1 Tax=Chlamydomonas schloesseri TaxID=2026947 RepID=A0A835WAV1_9CHLO|nr:hypothetical protein HYH02_009172 [Chlamydomonas schloesseri]KAG2443974.1 hypothetical protein HYH02_009175 [Chlamydomonas schloesseri]|eukprot:KAG2443971.1 hypothetical protein HYH02_009172 [Chlamydomonas schloesseri]
MGRRTDYTNADGKETHKTAMFASFKDSHQFMPCALAKLVDSLKASDKARRTDSFTITRGYLRGKGYTDAQIDLLLQKGIFPYSWFDDASKLDYPGLPSQDAFKDE